jgi:hypothetical protein
MHGAQAAQVRRTAAVRVAESGLLATFEKYGGPVDGQSGTTDVVAQLTRLVAEVCAFKDYAHGLAASLTAGEWQALDDPHVAATVGLWERAADRAARLLVDVGRLGVVERVLATQAKISEAQGAAMAAAIRRIVVDLGHDPNDPRVREIVYVRLGELIEGMNTAADG